MSSTKIRSLVKGLTYRVSSTFIIVILVYLITKDFSYVWKIGMAEFILKWVWYFIHERLWKRIRWGKK